MGFGFTINIKMVLTQRQLKKEETARLIADDEVEKKSGIYAFSNKNYLGIRTFS